MSGYDSDKFDEDSPPCAGAKSQRRAASPTDSDSHTGGSPTPPPKNSRQKPATPGSPSDSSPANSPPHPAGRAGGASSTDPDVEKAPPAHAKARATAPNVNRLPPLPPGGVVAAARYPGAQGAVPVVDYLDTSKPLVKSSRPVTKPIAPRMETRRLLAQDERREREEGAVGTVKRTQSINARRENERNYLKAQYEFEREKRNAEKIIYQRERAAQWSHRLAASPLGVDLVADSERIEDEVRQREQEERRRRAKAERHRRKIKNDIVVRALAEVPLLDEARRQKREMLEDERRQRALRDVQRVEAVQHRKLRDQDEMAELRLKKLEVGRRSPSVSDRRRR